MYLLNKKVDEKSPIKYALTRVFGVGAFLADFFCKKIGIRSTLRLEKLTSRQVTFLTDLLIKDKTFSKQEELSRSLYENITRLAQIRSYRGLRHKRGLPLRGQRTRTNSMTARRQNKIQNRLR
jgi:small subunit ribosomal protein S13